MCPDNEIWLIPICFRRQTGRAWGLYKITSPPILLCRLQTATSTFTQRLHLVALICRHGVENTISASFVFSLHGNNLLSVVLHLAIQQKGIYWCLLIWWGCDMELKHISIFCLSSSFKTCLYGILWKTYDNDAFAIVRRIGCLLCKRVILDESFAESVIIVLLFREDSVTVFSAIYGIRTTGYGNKKRQQL